MCGTWKAFSPKIYITEKSELNMNYLTVSLYFSYFIIPKSQQTHDGTDLPDHLIHITYFPVISPSTFKLL